MRKSKQFLEKKDSEPPTGSVPKSKRKEREQSTNPEPRRSKKAKKDKKANEDK